MQNATWGNTSRFLTKKLPLASFLATRGWTVEVEPYEPTQDGATAGTIFSFEFSPELKADVDAYDTGAAQAEVLLYESSRAYCVKLSRDKLAELRRAL